MVLGLLTPTSAQELKTVTVNGMTVSEETAKTMMGGCEFNPYEKLKQMGVVSSGAELVPQWTSGGPQAGIDPALACRLAKMFEYAGPCAKITSAYRSAAKQESLCGSRGKKSGCAAPGRLCHQYGLAVDISGSCLQRLRKIAPQFNLIQPPISGDPYHFQCAEHPKGNRGSCSGPCNGGLAINPDPNALASATNYSPSPSSGLTNKFRQMLGLEQQQPPPQQPPPSPIPQQQLPQNQQPTQYFAPEQQPTSQVPSSPGITGNEGSPTKPTSSSPPVGNDEDDFVTIPYKPSIAEQLMEIAFGTKSEENEEENQIVSSSSIDLVIDPNDVVSLGSQDASSSFIETAGPSVGSLQPGQTFTSPDLSFSPPAAEPPFVVPQSGTFAIFESMKQALLRALEILRPMGIRAALEGTHAHAEDFSE
jgi:hypothetical protein